MALFTYQAINKSGKRRKGKRRAESVAELVAALEGEGLFALDIKERKPLFNSTLKRKEKIEFIGQLAELITSGLPLFESLELLLSQSAEEKSSARYDMVHHLHVKVSEGEELGEALQSLSAFSKLECTFVEAGIASGNLGGALTSLKEFLQRSEKLRGKIVSALVYPAVLIVLACIALSSLLLFAVPSIEEFVDPSSSGLLTRSVISLSHLLRDFGAWIALAAPLVCYGAYRWLRPFFSALIRKIPAACHFLDELALSRYCALVGELAKARVQLPDSLALSRAALHEGKLKKTLEEIEARLRLGEGLDQPAQEKVQSKPLPSYMAQMLSVASKSGDIAGAFARMGAYYTERSYRRLDLITQLLQPALLIVIGLLIGLIMLAILVPMTELGGIE